MGPGRLRAQAVRMISRRQQQVGGDIRPDAVNGEKSCRSERHQRSDELVEAADLGVEELGALSQLGQCGAGSISDDIVPAGPERGEGGTQRCEGLASETGTDVARS